MKSEEKKELKSSLEASNLDRCLPLVRFSLMKEEKLLIVHEFGNTLSSGEEEEGKEEEEGGEEEEEGNSEEEEEEDKFWNVFEELESIV